MEVDEMLLEFVAESRDNLDQFDEDLISLEKTPDSPDLMKSIFRTIHTIKGSCGLIGLTKLESITHSGENLLTRVQLGEIPVTPEVMNGMHALSDSIRRIFTCVASQGDEGDLDVSDLLVTLERLQEDKPPINDNSAKPTSLFERMGGQEAVDATVNLFYTKVLQDERINHFFENVDLNYLLNKQKQFLTFAFGGPSNYDGEGLQQAHKHLVEEKGLNDTHFDAVIENLGGALMELKVPGDLIGEVARIARSVKSDVLNQTTPEEIVAPKETEPASLFDRMGGQEAVDATVNLFYTKVLQDERINHFFENVDLNYLLEKQKQFLTFAFGGPSNYDGEGLQKAHKHLVEEKGLNETHFDAVIENLGGALMELKVPGDLIGEVARIARSVKSDVLNQTTVAPKETEVAPVEASPPPADNVTAPAKEKVKKAPDKGTAKKGDRKLEDSSIRVDVNLLDKLMNLVGELVLARNQILQFSSSNTDASFLETSQHLNIVTSDLQEGVMKTRMQPIGGIWGKFPRIVRDLSMECGKKIRLETEGKDTELDKTLIEAIKDPLTHIIRNSVDHGIETPDVRRDRGKPEEGVLLLKSYHEGGQVNIEIIDDGGGIDPQKLMDKALSKELISSEQAARMSDQEKVNLIFMAGLSTAEKVTNVSGRGVGMDVVRTNIEKIGGTVDINTQLGEGTTLKIKIPLTLAIIPALIISTGGNRYTIPQVNLLELVRLDQTQTGNAIETIQGAPVYRLRGNLLPIVSLNEELGIPEKEDQGATNIVVLSANERQFGLVVEEICDAEEIVVKPLGNQLKGIKGYSGATIMGDGSIALILDVIGLAQKANVFKESRDNAMAESKEKNVIDKENVDKETLLIFRIGEDSRSAIPLSSVARLEEFKCSDIEYSGSNEVIQYRGEIIPLIDLSSFFDSSKQVERNVTIQTIIYTHGDKSVALVVDQILDIIEENITVKRSLTRKGILGTVVVKDKVTDLIDIEGIVRQTDPSFFQQHNEILALAQ